MTQNKNLMKDHPEIYHHTHALYPTLEKFFSYFRGDVSNELIPEMLNNFLENDQEIIQKTIEELTKLINENWDEVYLEEIVTELGAWISIENSDWKPSSHTYKEWIIDLRNILKNEYEKRLQNNSGQ